MNTSKPIAKKLSASELRELEAHSFVRRSDVYRYLRSNYSRLLSQKVGTDEGPSWDDTAAILSKRGYVSSRGDPLNGHAVRRVFRRVEQDLRRREVAAANQLTRPAPPSRQCPDWQPPLAASQRRPEPRTPPPQQPATETLPRAGPVQGTGNADAKLAAAKRQFDWMDRHIVQQPDED